MTDDQTKQAAERRGRQAETLVAWRYRLRGYRLLARRYRCPRGEIDLIMRKRNCVVFIEVKFTTGEANTLETVLPGPRQQARIRAAAGVFLAEYHDHFSATRIDVVVLQSPFRMIAFEDVLHS